MSSDERLDGGLEVDAYPARRVVLRVALVTETYPPEVNGVSLTVARFVEGLHALDHEVQLIRPRQPRAEAGGAPALGGERFHEVLMRGLPIPRYPDLRMGMPSKRSLVKLWSTRRPDVVHIATEGPLGWSALQAAAHLKIPVTSDFRTNFHAYSRHYGVGWLRKPIMGYLRKFHNATLRTLVPTEALRSDLAACGFRNLAVVSRGVDTELFNPARRSAALRAAWGADDATLVVMCVGRLAPEKNLDLLLRAQDAIVAAGVRSQLVLVGDGPQRDSLSARHPQARLAGQRRGADLAAHYASADLFLFPSMTETFGNVVTEAMASALPVVAFDHAAASVLLRDGDNGWRVPLGDEASFIAAAVAAAREPGRRARVAAAGHATACALGWEAVVQRFEAHLLEAAASAGGGAAASAGRPWSLHGQSAGDIPRHTA
jgi:glycosyltransferase involved in cell wall biosynthesis